MYKGSDVMAKLRQHGRVTFPGGDCMASDRAGRRDRNGRIGDGFFIFYWRQRSKVGQSHGTVRCTRREKRKQTEISRGTVFESDEHAELE